MQCPWKKESELWLAPAESMEGKIEAIQVLDSRRKCEGIFLDDSNILLWKKLCNFMYALIKIKEIVSL